MKKTIALGLVASMMAASGSAMAEDVNATSLTTKNYVDSGLRAVYSTAKDAKTTADTAAGNITTLQGSVSTLQNTVGNETTGLVKDVADLKTAVGGIDVPAYTGGDGITIDEDEISITGLATTQEAGNTNKMYVFKNGALAEIPVQNDWSADILTQN